MDIEQARQAKQKLIQLLKHIPQVTGVGIGVGSGKYAIEVRLKTSIPAGVIPSQIDGVVVNTRTVGEITFF